MWLITFLLYSLHFQNYAIIILILQDLFFHYKIKCYFLWISISHNMLNVDVLNFSMCFSRNITKFQSASWNLIENLSFSKWKTWKIWYLEVTILLLIAIIFLQNFVPIHKIKYINRHKIYNSFTTIYEEEWSQILYL